MKSRLSGFTLIELLIVVAIIAILAAIAIPNYLSAQVRTKVSSAKAEMRTITTALESYYNDNNAYPRWVEKAQQTPPAGYVYAPLSWRLLPLTTPVSYLAGVPVPDPFRPVYTFNEDYDLAYVDKAFDSYSYIDAESSRTISSDTEDEISSSIYGRMWRLASSGPDRIQNHGKTDFCGCGGIEYGFYDPSNGVCSNGDIVRLGPPSQYFQEHVLGFEP